MSGPTSAHPAPRPRPAPSTGPVRLTPTSRVTLRPATGGVIAPGFWAERRRVNRQVSVPGAWDRLQEAGNVANLELAAGRRTGTYTNELPFLDSDVYKWQEAIGWTLADPELAEEDAARLEELLSTSTELLEAAQQDDGYLDSYFQVLFPGERFVQLDWGHELYCAGHLIQAAIAVHRTSADTGLFAVARRLADLVVRSFGTGEGQVDGVCGHPEIETALVELFRETGERSYLETARYFVDRRGHGLIGPGRFGAHYWQDHVPVRDALSVEGHAVRQLYLLAGVADVYTETGDDSLRDAAERLWAEMAATKTYLTGGVGAHHTDEAFGDPYELPNERSYCETCAAIASVMFSWRMLMVTGEARYADLLERTLYNGFLGGLSLKGQSYSYANPLQVREGHLAAGNDRDYTRQPWFHCACCPPNVMRLLASLEHYVVLSSDDQVRVHQFVPGSYAVEVGGGEATLRVETDYPWDGRVRVVVESGPDDRWVLGLRVPQWATTPTTPSSTSPTLTVTVNGQAVAAHVQHGWLTVSRQWRPGDDLVLDLPLEVRLTRADPRVDADRGQVALERGPLVYCLEAVDHPGRRLDDILLDVTATPVAERSRVLGGVTVLRAAGMVRHRNPQDWWPYGESEGGPSTTPVPLVAVPYFVWGNRQPGAMRVWVPAGEAAAGPGAEGSDPRSGGVR